MATAIITGASSGIGRGVAKLFAAAGYKLVLCGRNEQELQATVRLCNSSRPDSDRIATCIGDIAAADACQRIVDEAIGKFKRIDVLVNNAGMLLPGSPPDGLKIEDLKTMMNVNLLSGVELSIKCFRHLMATKGCIVNVSSICGIKPLPNWAFYSMTKAAMDMFTKMMALEMAPHGVRVNSVNPGIIPTQVHSRRLDVSKEEIDEYYKTCVSQIPMGKVGTVENIAEMVLFLASDKASYITGQTHIVDGGLTL
ncbi:oxidoreductase, short chain dehydrogenase/reductase family protein [Trichuris suis]|nr:oxidoreductase, short chain dehydrogenase/reductase family protein [Trichuris suis]